ncbi:hypothetical protein [Megasphaera cerevisiae]|uniref:hypothetical protein n=1 Tax=Megasphaera cerevisiae TaxID=39029 RepID=UPI00069DE4F1|nr:hypothetical protein [Megasphaera cerevisiae]SJZ57380.1 hypothetical protein SAMN05660900_00832 [Megasphaera cerevisiae DSM 20462]
MNYVKSLRLAMLCIGSLYIGVNTYAAEVAARATAPPIQQTAPLAGAGTVSGTVLPAGKDAAGISGQTAAPTVAELVNSLDTLVIPPLSAADFSIGNVRRGDSLAKVRRVWGSPNAYSQSIHYTKLKYDDTDKTMRFVLRNDTASILKQTVEERQAVRVGVEAVFLVKGKGVPMGRNLRLQYPAEVLVRQFGMPSNVLRDVDANVYYFVYESPRKDTMMVFAIGDRKIERVALMPPRPPYVYDDITTPQSVHAERDFALMGFSLDTTFQANKYNMWSNLIKRNGNNFWLYGDYGVEVDRHNLVKKVFLLTNNGYTGRGATLGYHISTILALYGHPDRVDLGGGGEKSVDAYYYDSPFQKGVSLVFIVDHAKQFVDDVILTSEPIKNMQDPMERYGLK